MDKITELLEEIQAICIGADSPDAIEKEPKFTYEEKDGVLYVYERKLVAKYNIENK